MVWTAGDADLSVAGLPHTAGAQSLDWLHAQAERLAHGSAWESGQIHAVQLPADAPRFLGAQPVSVLTVVPLAGWARPETPQREERERKEFGWLALGFARPLNARQEILVAAVTQHLSSLAMLAQAESALALRDQFLSVASHELKTPLTSIYGVLQLQERMLRPRAGVTSGPDQEKQRSFFKVVIRQVERLNELIDGLLDVSRIQNGRFLIEPAEVDVSQIVQETVSGRLGPIAADSGVQIQLDMPIHVSMWVDPVRFEEVVTNLGMNAIRFSPEGGIVWVKLRDESGALVLTVRDQGPALPEQDRARIFQPFERAQRTSRLGGLGLGLFISRQIAQLHGGDVALTESLVGKGNLFEARFPARDRQQISA